MSRFAPFCAVLLFGPAACLFQPPTAPPPSLPEPKDAQLPDRGDANDGDAGEADTSTSADAGGENRPPIARADTATTAPNAPIDIAVLSNDSDPDGDRLAIVSFTTPMNGSVTMMTTGIEYAPNASYEGADQFSYRISDGRGGAASAKVDIIVSGPPALLVVPSAADINLNSRGAFTASGGTPPYSFSIATGGGEIDPSTGEFFSPGVPGTARVLISDGAGSTRSATVTFGEGDLFYLGGFGDAGDQEEVYRSNDGVTFSEIGSLPAPLYLHAAVVFEGQIFVAGGRNQSFEASQLLLASSDGIIWVTRGMLPVPLRGAQLVVFRQRLFLLAGRDSAGASHREVWSSPDGTTGSWIIEGQLPAERAYGSALVHGGELWYAGGGNQGVVSEVWSSSDGAAWIPRASLPAPRLYMGAAIHGDQIWFIGGSADGDDGTVEVWRSDGQTFTEATALPQPTASAQAVQWRDTIWIVGGGTRLGGMNAEAYDAVLSLTNGAWSQIGELPFPRFYGAIVIFDP